MTHVGDAFASSSAVDPPSAGSVLAERYRLERHIGQDASGRSVWRGVDVILQRSVAVVLRTPGGENAEEMLRAAVTASQVTHSNLVGVYDAIDQEDHAFVVREWIDGSALREAVLADGPLDAERTTFILHAVAEAVAALHNSGTTHGNIHPGTILIGDDGRIVVTDARFDSDNSTEADVRAVGACGYFMINARAVPPTATSLVGERAGSGASSAKRSVPVPPKSSWSPVSRRDSSAARTGAGGAVSSSLSRSMTSSSR